MSSRRFRRGPPPPSPLRRVDTAASIAKENAAAIDNNKRVPMETFCDMLYARICAEMFMAKFNTVAHIGTFLLPTAENCQRDFNRCYWRGTPIFQLLKGVRDSSGEFHPERLWGGQTAIDNMNEVVSEDGWIIYNHYSKSRKEFQVYLICCVNDNWEQVLNDIKVSHSGASGAKRQRLE